MRPSERQEPHRRDRRRISTRGSTSMGRLKRLRAEHSAVGKCRAARSRYQERKTRLAASGLGSGVNNSKYPARTLISLRQPCMTFSRYCLPRYKCDSPDMYRRSVIRGSKVKKNCCCRQIHLRRFHIFARISSSPASRGARKRIDRSGLTVIPRVLRSERISSSLGSASCGDASC